MIKVCIIGCGMIANNAHIPAYLENKEDFSIIAVCDFNVEFAKNTAEKFGIESYYSSAEEMLKRHTPDLVSVCTPNLSHKEFVALALEYGANVLCEKPLATTYADAKFLFDIAKKQNKILMTCQSLRFLPERLAAKKLIDNGKVGEVYYAEASRIRKRGIPTWGKFHIKSANGGGALLDIGVHAIDSAIWLMGNPTPKTVTAVMKKVHADEFCDTKSSGALKGGVEVKGFNPDEMDVEDFSCGMLKFKNGVLLKYEGTLSDEADVTIKTVRKALLLMMGGSFEQFSEKAVIEGDKEQLKLIMSNLNRLSIENADRFFNIIEP